MPIIAMCKKHNISTDSLTTKDLDEPSQNVHMANKLLDSFTPTQDLLPSDSAPKTTIKQIPDSISSSAYKRQFDLPERIAGSTSAYKRQSNLQEGIAASRSTFDSKRHLDSPSSWYQRIKSI
jgi:hypothetical protein